MDELIQIMGEVLSLVFFGGFILALLEGLLLFVGR